MSVFVFVDRKYVLILCLLLLSYNNVLAQDFRSASRKYNEASDTLDMAEGDLKARSFRGHVSDAKTGELLPVAVVRNLHGKEAVSANERGNFIITLDVSSPVFLVCTYIGYVSDTIRVEANTGFINIRLQESFQTMKDIVVSASRKNERKFESPVTIETLKQVDIQYNPSLNMYERMVNMPTVDVITTSANFKTLNTRGFNSSYNQRFIQRFDNMDLSMPGFNLSLGALNGPVDLDVETMELIPGANSALYGPNAISGLMNTIPRNPFTYQGLSVEIKSGVNHIDGKDQQAAPMYEFDVRYAKVLSKKWAAKVTFGYQKLDDWHATDYRDISDYNYSNNLKDYGYSRGPGNPGYNGLNIGGDEVSTVLDSSLKAPVTGDPFLPKGSLRVSRTGYKEDQIFSYKPEMIKGDVSFFYRPTKDVQISWTSRFGWGSSNFQTDNRTQVTGYNLQQHKLEAKGKNFSFRSYINAENLGEAIDISLTSVNLNRTAKPDENWFMQYLMAYSGFYNNLAKANGWDTIRSGNDQDARKFADGNNQHLYNVLAPFDTANAWAYLILGDERYEPGTARFDSVMNIIKNKSFNENGGRIRSSSKNWYSELTYDFSNKIRFMSLQTGINYRLYMPYTYGSVFPDSTKRIYFNEVGGFVQGSKAFLNNRLKLQGSVRLDMFQYFNPRFSPRLSLVYLAGSKQQHSFRTSAQIGYRMPALIDMYSYMNVRGALTFGGFLSDAERLGLVKGDFVNMYTGPSVSKFLYTGDSSVLVKPNVGNIAPEELRTIEFGWRSFLYGRLESDVTVYFNQFQNLINAQQYIGPVNRNDSVNAAMVKAAGQTQVYRRAANANFPVSAWGLSVSSTWYQSSKWAFYANYNYNQMITSETLLKENFEKGFNTPKHKINAGVRGIRIYKGLGITGNIRWVGEWYFREYDREGTMPAYSSTDLILTYTIPKQHVLLKIGGTNIANHRYTQSIGSPTVGALFYCSFIFDEMIR